MILWLTIIGANYSPTFRILRGKQTKQSQALGDALDKKLGAKSKELHLLLILKGVNITITACLMCWKVWVQEIAGNHVFLLILKFNLGNSQSFANSRLEFKWPFYPKTSKNLKDINLKVGQFFNKVTRKGEMALTLYKNRMFVTTTSKGWWASLSAFNLLGLKRSSQQRNTFS